MAGTASRDRDDWLSVGWNDVVRFVRQLGHDLRNHLNAAELQAAYMSELTSDPELAGEIKRLRELISQIAKELQQLNTRLGQQKLNFMPYRATEFVEDLRDRIEKEFPHEKAAIDWDVRVGDAMIDIDPQLFPQAFIELFANAFQHQRGKGTITVTAKIDSDQFIFLLREPKTGPELSVNNWGREPLRTVGPNHYGLGLNLARVIIEGHHGGFRAQYDSAGSSLVSTVALPISKGQL